MRSQFGEKMNQVEKYQITLSLLGGGEIKLILINRCCASAHLLINYGCAQALQPGGEIQGV